MENHQFINEIMICFFAIIFEGILRIMIQHFMVGFIIILLLFSYNQFIRGETKLKTEAEHIEKQHIDEDM